MKREVHGMCGTGVYRAWAGMKARCLNTNGPKYKDYGGRGITICESWRNSFIAFFNDMGEKPSKLHSLDRIDNNKGYSKENCRWATAKEQRSNTRVSVTFKGETAIDASIRLGGNKCLVAGRLHRRWRIEEAFLTPYIENKSKDKNKQRRILCHSDL